MGKRCNAPIITRNEVRSAVRVRSSALLNSLSPKRSSSWGGSPEKAGSATVGRVAPRDADDLLAQALGWSRRPRRVLMVVSALASLEGQLAGHVLPPTAPRSIRRNRFILIADDVPSIELFAAEVAPATRELVAAERTTHRGCTLPLRRG